ncbi:MAG: DegT/DnrJ/EryC1/StrS family aminotransferase [Deltaproteobacteria bacterium]|nr:MAG: DegT/DnrJ/EryC1/StrS family aminotransferase [Deltaproteobacteria bacterium]
MKVELLDLKAQYQEIEKEVKTAIDQVLAHQHFILGPEVKELEEEIARYCEVSYAIGVASGSDALLLSLMAIGVGEGDVVLTTPYTFFATAGSISRLGARPVFIDIDPKTYNIDPVMIKKYLKRYSTHKGRRAKIKAIIPVHLFGQCAEMEPILELAEKNGLKVIEDAAQALGAEYKGQKAGTMGDVGCFSFFPSKNLGGMGDGGMIVTNDQSLAKRFRSLRVHGTGKMKYSYSHIGINSRLDTLQASVLKVKLKYLDEWNEGRRENATFYDKAFKDSQVVTPYATDHNLHIYNQYTIRVPNRDGLLDHLNSAEIGCAIYYPIPLHIQDCFKSLGNKEGDFPESEKAAKETLSIPIYPELNEQQKSYIVDKILEFIN